MGSDLRQKFLKPALRAGARSAALFWATTTFLQQKISLAELRWLFGQIEALRASHWQVGGRERACGRLGTSVRAAGNGMPGGRQCKRPVRLTGACTQAVRWLGMGCREAGNRMCLPAGGGGMIVCLSKTFHTFLQGAEPGSSHPTGRLSASLPWLYATDCGRAGIRGRQRRAAGYGFGVTGPRG